MSERSEGGTRTRWRGTVLGLIALLLAGPARPDDGGELLLGAVPLDIPAVMHQRLKPLADYLGQELGRPVRLRLSPDYTEAVNEVSNGTVDIAYLAPVAYVRAHAAGGTRAIAGAVTRGRAGFRLVLVTRTDSPIREPKDLAGRSFALGDPSAHLQRAVLLDAGVRIEQFRSHKFLGSFDNIARGVANGDFDAGIVKDTTAWQWEGRGLRAFHHSPELPPYNIAVSRRVDDALAGRIQQALLRLTAANPQQAAIIRALDPSYDGFAAAADRDYDTVRRMVRTLPP